MIVSFLKQGLKLFWDNCELVVVSHLLENLTLFFANVWRGRLFFIFNWLWKAEFLCQPISEYWNQTTTLIPFLPAIKYFCNFISSYFMEGFTFLIDETSYLSCNVRSHITICLIHFATIKLEKGNDHILKWNLFISKLKSNSTEK